MPIRLLKTKVFKSFSSNFNMKIFQFVIAGLAALSLVSAGDPEQDDVIPPSDVVVLTSGTFLWF